MNSHQVIVEAICRGIAEEADCVVIDRDADTADTGYDLLHVRTIARYVLEALGDFHTITTVDALHALPVPTPDDLAGVLIKTNCLVDPDNGAYGLGEVYERNTDGTWCLLQDPSGSAWSKRQLASTDIPLPATVLWGR